MSKFMKSFFILSLLILTGGVFCLVPNPLIEAKAEQNIVSLAGDENEKVGQAGVETTTYAEFKNLLDGVNVETKALGKTEKYGYSNVFTISSKEDLAFVAYKVASGGQLENGVSATEAVYSLETDIDLAGALWTPIGTSTHTFSGIFYGNGHVISNITINDASLDSNSNSMAGLFGNIQNASICDIILEGSMVYNTTRTKGALVGTMTTSDIINCYDECDKSGSNGESFNSVGSQSSSRVFRGGSYDGKVIQYTSKSAINEKFTVPSDTTVGYVGTYYLTQAGAKFYRANSQWYETNLVRVLFNSNLDPYGTSARIANNLYQTQIPTLRENAGEINIYPLCHGMKATIGAISSAESTGYVYTVSFTSSTTSVNFNHGYGTRTSTTVTVGYDTTFNAIFTDKSYLKNRLGYNMTGLKRNSDSQAMKYASNDWDYKLSYPTASETYNFVWEALTDRKFDFQFAVSNDEGSLFGDCSALGAAIVGETTANKFSLSNSTMNGDSFNNNAKLSANKITSGNSVELKFTLAYGYKISAAVSSDTVTLEENTVMADKTSGIYPVFANTTNQGADYTVDGKNNDSYNPVTATVTSKANETRATNTDYTVTVNNIVGTNGTIYIVVERIEIEIDLTPYYVSSIGNDPIAYTWDIVNGDGNFVDFSSNEAKLKGVARIVREETGSKEILPSTFVPLYSYKLYIKYGENAKLNISVVDDQNVVITGIKSHRYSGGAPTGQSIGDEPEFSVNNTDYYLAWQVLTGNVVGYSADSGKCGVCENEDTACLHVSLAKLQTKIETQLYDEKGQIIDFSGKHATLGMKINSSDKILNAEKLIGMQSKDSINIYNNGYYRLNKIEITDLLSNNTPVTITPETSRTFSAEEIFEGNYFSKVFGYDNNESTNYQVKVYYELRTYSLGYQFIFPDDAGTTGTNEYIETDPSELNSLFSFSVVVKDIDGATKAVPYPLNAGDQVEITITFTNKGKALLFVPSSEHFGLADETQLSAEDGYQPATPNAGTQNATGGVYNYSFIVGSYDSVLKFKYEYRQVEYNISQLYDNAQSVAMTTPYTPSFNLSYNFTGNSVVLSPVGNQLGGISIHSQYYLMGWYLQNGQVKINGVGAEFADLYQHGDVVDSVVSAGAGSAKGKSFAFSGLQAFVGKRTVAVNALTGGKGAGQFYDSDKTTLLNENAVKNIGNVVFGQEMTVPSTTFYNLGYSFTHWTAQTGTLKDNKYTIVDNNWDTLFGSTSLSQTWTGFASDVDSNKNNDTNKTVTLTAHWQIISYEVKIDNYANAEIQIGSSIKFASQKANRDGMATYSISTPVQTINGSSMQGYWVSGYDIGFNLGLTGEKSNKTNRTENTYFYLTPENFRSFMKENYYFVENDENNPVEIATVREEATYKLYLDSIAGTNYFSYGINETKLAEYGGKDSSNNKYYVNVKYNAKAQELLDAISNGAININRVGYSHAGWVISNNGAQTATVFNPNDVYTVSSPADRFIVPTWKLQTNTASSNLAFGEDVGAIREFYLTNSHDILFGNISGSTVDSGDTLAKGLVLNNGEEITDFGFSVTFDGKTTAYSGTSFNISTFAKAGGVQVSFFINIKDKLSTTSTIKYTATSSSLSFTMKENNIFFYDYNLVSVYNGTNEYVPATADTDGEENEFGKFLYRYDWNGSLRTQGQSLTAKGATSEFFNNFSIEESSFNVGSGKKVRAYLNLNKFGQSNVWSNLFDNVEVDDNGDYYVVINTRVTKGADGYTETVGQGPLKIARAKITLSFEKGSAYYMEGVTAVVYTNSLISTFSVGEVTFSYNYSHISLKPNALPGLYKGTKDYTADCNNFVVYGLKVNDSIIVTDTDGNFINGNFEFNIAKADGENNEYQLLDSSNAIRLEYVTKYLLAENGQLVDGLANSYGDQVDNLVLKEILVDQTSKTLEDAKVNNGQFSLFVGDNFNGEIIMSVAGNESGHLYVYINRNVLDSNNVSFTLKINYATGHSNVLYPLAWSNSEVNSFGNMFESENAGKGEFTLDLTNAQASCTTYAVLTDAVKINLDFNGGKIGNETNKTIYVSAGINATGKYSIAKPVYSYSGISFGGYTSATEANLTILENTNDTTFAVAKGGKGQSLKAKWNFNEINASLLGNKITRYASETGIQLAVSDIANIVSPELFEKNFALVVGGVSYSYSSTTGKFAVENEKGYAITSMGGEAKLTLTFKFNDNVQSPQTKSKDLTFDFEILINTIEVSYSGEALTFNNTDQTDKVTIDFTFNGEEREENSTVKISQLSTTDEATALNAVYVSANPSLKFRNAGQYIVTFKVASALTEIYQFANNLSSTTLNVSISKYEISLKDYVEQISPAKVFGGVDPSPISSIITIAENANDTVELAFTRASGEAVGQYLLTFSNFVSDDDKNNYTVDTVGFEDYFEIVVPSGNLKLELNGIIQYVYNGYAVSNISTTYNSDNKKFEISASAGSQTISTTFDLYYESGSTKVAIPESERGAYAQFVSFSSNAQAGVGTYLLIASLTQQAQTVGWSGIDIVNSANAIVLVNKRIVSLTDFEKIFDQTNEFVYNNVNTSSNTATLTLENVVSINGTPDEIIVSGKISSSFVGEVELLEVSITNESAKNNYTLNISSSLSAKVIADSETEVTATPEGETTFDYGKFFEGISIEKANELLPVVFNNGNIAKEYISVTGIAIQNATYSAGKFLNQGKYNVVLTLSSSNFTFGEEREASLLAEYTTTQTIEITINPIAITINNSSLAISKIYDGNNVVLEKFVNQNVNASGGYYTSNGILDGDVITIVSALYNDKTIATNKTITLTFSANDDSENYTITQNIIGDIAKVNLTFKKNGATITFVDGVKEFANTADLKIDYTGDLDAVIESIENVTTYLTRVGYTQTGWTYEGKSISVMTAEEKENLLQDAVDSASNGITIDAVWEINKYTLTVNAGSHASASIESQELSYYDSIESITVESNEGYTFEGINANFPAHATLEIVGETGNRNGEFSLAHILGNIAVSILTEEITVKIIINHNTPSGQTVVTENTTWGLITERIVSFSELSTTDLPELKMQNAGTYDFAYWTLGANQSQGDTIWERIGGANLTKDNTDAGFTFVANWEEADLYIKITASDNAIITVKDGGGNVIEKGANGYLSHYLATVTIEVSHNAWYKWSGVSISGTYSEITGDRDATNAKDGTFTIKSVQSEIAITISTEAIKVNFTTSYDTTAPYASSINETSGSITGLYTADGEMTTIEDAVESYTAKAGTYKQANWTSGGKTIALTSNPQTAIAEIYGSIPTSDITLSLVAQFEGCEYEVTFVKGAESANASFVGQDAGKETTTRMFVYGSVISNMPVLQHTENKDYIWITGANEIFSNGMTFTTTEANSNCTLTMTAEWTNIPYEVKIVLSANSAKVSGITANGVAINDGDTVQVMLGGSQSYIFAFATGYEFDQTASNITVGSDDTSLVYNGNEITVANVMADTTITVSVKAKDYTLTIKNSGYETLNKEVYNISYDQSTSGLFSGAISTRSGYILKGLNVDSVNGTTFATYSSNAWTISNSFIDENGLYNYDGNLELVTVWEYNANAKFITLNTSATQNVYYNSTSQKVAETQISVASGETFALDKTFNNGEQVVDVYYMLDGKRATDQNDFSYNHVDYISNGSLYMIVVVKDLLTNTTHTIESTPVQVNVNKTDVIVKDYLIQSYYTGSSKVELADGASFGNLYFHDNTTSNSQLSITKVELIDQTEKYSVKTGYSAKYYLTPNASFKEGNYSGLTQEGGLYTFVLSANAQIISSDAVLNISGKGYENGSVHKVENASISLPDYVENATANVVSVYTKQSITGLYDNVDSFDITIEIKNGSGEDISENFNLVLSGSYTIVSTQFAYEIEAKGRYFNGETVEDKADHIVSITSIVYNGKTIQVGSMLHYMDNDELIFSIDKNGTKDASIFVTNGKSLTINFALSGDLAVVIWTSNASADNVKNTLNTLQTEGSRSYSATVSQEVDVYAVVTDYKAVLQNLGDKGGNQGYVYVKLGSSVTISNPESWTGFEFANWVVENGEGISLNTNSLSATGEITSASIKAVWTIAKPTVETKKFTTIAKFDGSKVEIDLDDILQNGIENKNESEISYTYEFLKGTTSLSTESSFEINALTSSSGTYSIKITAKKNGYVSNSQTFEFEVDVQGMVLSAVTFDNTTFTYQNKDYMPEINVTLGGVSTEAISLDTLTQNESPYGYYTFAGNEIRNAGEYSLTLNLSNEVFDLVQTDSSLASQTYKVTVNKADLEIVQSDIPSALSEKLLGSNDPEFKFDKQTSYNESVEIILARTQGESQGEYAFHIPADFALANYNLSLADGVKFTIKQADVTLLVAFDSTISAVYTGASHTFGLSYDTTAGKWVVSLGSSKSTLSLSYKNGDETIIVSGTLYTIALENISLAFDSAINAGEYDAKDMTATGEGNFAGYQISGKIVVETKGIILSAITKVFDRNDEIKSTSANLSGLVAGDDVSLSGKYKQVTVGNGIELTNLVLSGADCGNYHIANEDSATGNITPLAITSASITIQNSEFTYGQIGKDSNLIELMALIGGATLSLDGVTDDLANRYVAITSITLDENGFATSNKLKEGNQVITVGLASQNFTGLSTLQVSIQINPLEIDLSALSSSIVKVVDGTNKLPESLSTNIDSYLFDGDIVSIDKTLSHYDDETIAVGKKVTIALTGADSGNYIVKDNVTGTINAFSITLIVNASTEDNALVTDGAFALDGLSPIVETSQFVLSYPTEENTTKLVESLTLPKRTGYTPLGWKYHDGNGYVELDETNIISVLQNASTTQDKTVEIYTVWEIEYYSISVEGNNFTSTISGEYVVGDSQNGYKTRYFSDIQVKITGERGYKVKSYILTSGSVNNQTFSEMGRNQATATLEKIASKIVLKGEMEAIKVTFTVDLNLPEFTERTDNNNTSYTFGYTQLASKYESDIAPFTVTEGTYYLDGLAYADKSLIGEKTLKEVVDLLYSGELTTDFSVDLTASWQGEEYSIIFDMNGGSLENGLLSLMATYGKGITGSFPTVKKAGQSYKWKASDGTEYIQSDILKTVGSKNASGKWELTLKAEWTNETFTLSFVIGEKITVEVGGTTVASGSTRDVVYGETVLSLKVTCQQGYTYNINKNQFNGTIEGANGNYQVKDLIEDSTLVFEKVCADNTLTLKLANIAEYTVEIDGEAIASSLSIVAKTESSVNIVFKAVKGYEFAKQNISFTGNGEFNSSISEDKKTLTCSWANFVNNGRLTVSAIASDNIIKIEDASLYLQALSINGQSINVGGGEIIAKTASTVTVQATLKYGYHNGSISTKAVNYVKEGSQTNTFSSSDKCFHFSAVLEGFDEGFTVEFSAEKRTYMIEVLVADGQSEYGKITTDSPQYVVFGEKLILAQKELRYDYIFDSWRYTEKNIISTNETDEIVLDLSQKALLESVEHGESIKVYAHYIKCTIDVTFTSNSRGSFDIIQVDVESGEEKLLKTVLNGRSEVVEIMMGQNIILKLHGDKGYEIDNVKVNNVSIVLADYGFTEENHTLAIFADMENKITKIDVSFKASEIRVTVRAGVQIRYEEVLGVDIGGHFYATDMYGERLDDSVYLENDGKFILGADYQMASVTDKTLYFVVENNGGYTFTVSCEGETTLNEYTYNGKRIYSFIGTKEDITIKAIFVAKENRVKVQFALEGKTAVAYAGVIAVDSSSILVSASPNRAAVLDIAVVTSADLKLNVYSSLAYSLAKDENGYLKYKIVYSGKTEYDEVTAGTLTPEDQTTLGFTYSSNLEIKNVNSNATIYIYVVPQEYTIEFAVSDTESVFMSEKVRYGEEFNLGSLTLEEFNIVFQKREGFSFTGYFTHPLGFGTQYINSNLEIVSAWFEDGYEFDGTKYVEETNFDSTTNTITLYAGWIYNKAFIEVEFLPEAVADSDESYNITNIITNFDPERAWTDQYDKWYAEVLIGSSLDFRALSFGGYDFVSWEVTFEDGEPVAKPANFTLANIQLGRYVIKAIYNPTYKIIVQNLNNGKSDGGKSYIVQDGKQVVGTSFDKDKIVTLKSEANDGYKFLYWLNITTGQRYTGTVAGDGTCSYKFSETMSSPLEIKAVFTGKTVLVNFDANEGGQVHEIKEITINGKTIDYSGQFSVCVGDEIKVFVTKAQGYGFNFIGAPMFETFDAKTGYYVFSYTFRTNELTKLNNETYSINIRFEAPKEKLKLMFNVKVEDAVDEIEFSKAGKLIFKNASGLELEVSPNTEYTITYGDNTSLTIKDGENYRLAYVYLKNPNANEITAWVIDGQLIIDQDFIQNYFARNITIDVYFTRLVWSMEEFRATRFAGRGTEEKPYLISSEEEFALVAYYVNNGIGNYANAYYKLTANLDFKGKYWEPIGTEENKFDGTFDLGGYSIENVNHYLEYSNPNTSYGGLFWHLGDDARIIKSNRALITIACVIGVIILLIILVILIIMIIKKKRRRNIDRLARF